MASLAPARTEVEAGVVTKADIHHISGMIYKIEAQVFFYHLSQFGQIIHLDLFFTIRQGIPISQYYMSRCFE